MLGRCANGMHWMFRYLERAENTARLVDAGFHLALTRDPTAASEEWRSVLVTLGQDQAYLAGHGDFAAEHVFNFILRGKDNPASVTNMLAQARTNARAVRTELTRSLWEAVNESWMIIRDMTSRPLREGNLVDVLCAIRNQASMVRGELEGAMLRRESYHFARMGTFIERADNAARILDVKYYLLLPSITWVGSSLDNVQWETILRSFAGDRAYRWLNAGGMDQRSIIEFLILDRRFPRSLAFSYDQLDQAMEDLAEEYGERPPSHAVLKSAANNIRETDLDSIFEEGLHEFLSRSLATTNAIGAAIATDYRFVD